MILYIVEWAFSPLYIVVVAKATGRYTDQNEEGHDLKQRESE